MDNVFCRVEKALGIKLYPWQKEYIANGVPIPTICPCLIDNDDTERIRQMCRKDFDMLGDSRCRIRGRMTGKTLAHCIRLALSEGEPLNMSRPEEFSDCDRGINNIFRYARGFYRREFLKVWQKLKDAGFKVRDVRGLRRVEGERNGED